MTPHTDIAVPELDELAITIVDNTTDTLSSVSPGIPQLPELAYLLGGVPTGQHDGHDCVTTFDQLCVACHGFSALATARHDDQTATVLFDVGPYGDVWLAIAARLAVDLASIDVLFLSHWHWDHSGGITTVVSRSCRSATTRRRPPPRPTRPAWNPHPIRQLRDAPAGAHLRSDRSRRSSNRHDRRRAPLNGLFSASGDIRRQTNYETGGIDGRRRPDRWHHLEHFDGDIGTATFEFTGTIDGLGTGSMTTLEVFTLVNNGYTSSVTVTRGTGDFEGITGTGTNFISGSEWGYSFELTAPVNQ